MDAKGTQQIFLWFLHPTNSQPLHQQQLCCLQKEQLHHLPTWHEENRLNPTQPTAAAAAQGEQQQLLNFTKIQCQGETCPGAQP